MKFHRLDLSKEYDSKQTFYYRHVLNLKSGLGEVISTAAFWQVKWKTWIGKRRMLHKTTVSSSDGWYQSKLLKGLNLWSFNLKLNSTPAMGGEHQTMC